ncbi:hypothetical protein [Amorphus sp. MBR-141]
MGQIATLANAAYVDGVASVKSSIRAVFGQVDTYVEDLRTRVTAAEGDIDDAESAITALQATDVTHPNYGETSADRDRPGEVRKFWTSTLDGAPAALTPISESWVVATAFGAAVRLTGAQYLAPIAATMIEPGRQYRIRAAYRANSTTDPDGDTVQLGIRWLDKDKAGISTTVAANVLEFSTADGRANTSVVVAKTAATGVDVVPPASAVYMRPFVRTFSASGQIDVDVLEVVDLYDTVDWSPDVEAVENRMSTAEQDIDDLEDRATAVEGRSTDLEEEVTNARNGEANLDDRLDGIDTALAQEITDRAADVDAEEAARIAADNALDGRLDAVEAEITTARGGEANLDARLDGIDTAILDEATARADADTALDGRLDLVESEITTARGGQASLDDRLDVMDATDADFETRVDALETEMTAARGGEVDLDTRLDGMDTATAGAQTTADTAQAEITAARGGEANLDARLDGIDTAVSTAQTAADDAQADADTVTAEVTAARGGEVDLDTRLDGIASDVTTAQGTADTAQSEITTARGGEASLDARLDGIDTEFTDRPALQRLTIADDAATSFTPVNTVGRIAISGPSAALTGDVFFDAVSPACTALVAAADIEVTTGALTGTDGSDAKLTVSAHTDGNIYVENRTGASIDIVLLTIS